MKNPLMLPSYLCGECGIEMLVDHAASSVERAREGMVRVRCYTPRCPQKDVRVTVVLIEALVVPPC